MAVASHSASRSSQQHQQYSHSYNFYNDHNRQNYQQQQQQQQPRQQQQTITFAQSWSQPQSLAIPRSAQTPSFTFSSPVDSPSDEVPPLPLDQVPELMNDHHWQASQAQQHFSTPRGIGGLPVHQRNSSLSTLGSAGPSSPYAQTTSNPQIAVTDSTSDGFPDVSFQDAPAMYAGKHNMAQESFYSQYPSSLSHSRNHQHHHHQQQSARNGTLLPPPEFQFPASSNPVSVASSIASDSPATPCMDDHQPVSRRQKQSFNPSAPKLNSMTDVCSDELFNSNCAITTTVSPSTPTSAVSPNSDLFNQRIHAANNQHLSAAQSPATSISRDRSPFRQGSPLAPLSHDFNNTQRMPAASHQEMRFPSSQQARAERDAAAAAMMRQQQQMASRHSEPESIKTISPKDAMLEFPESEDAANFPLFPQQDNGHHFMDLGDVSTAQGFGSIPVTSAHDASFAGFIPTTLPEQYHNFMSRSNDAGDMHHLSTDVHQLQQHHQKQQQQQQQHQQQHQQQMQTPTSPQKPVSSSTDRGTFSCTYQGCPLRFETAALLQKHKREGHRQAHGLGAGRRDTSMVAGITSTQNGPHKCTQINPSTGKPCNTEFSRPYDLTRHEDTIHNPKKKKVTCPACTDKKQFSRGDALSRHYRVCHPDLAPPGKRRGGAGRG